MAVNTQFVKETGVGQARINVAAFQQRFDVIVKERNEVFSQEIADRVQPAPNIAPLHNRPLLLRRFPESAVRIRIHPPDEQT